MLFQKVLVILLLTFQTLPAIELEEFRQSGYVEICHNKHPAATYDALYASFDELINFLQTHPIWAQKLHLAKERFIRSKDRNDYSTDFFGLYDESERKGRHQVAFYYAIHFHEFVKTNYPEFKQIPEIMHFFEACSEIIKPYSTLFEKVAKELGVGTIFAKEQVPILFKVIKYLPNYNPLKPHYDGTAFSLFLDSTDNASLLLAPYHSSSTREDFSSPIRDQASILLIPGAFLTEFCIYPTPHIVIPSGKTRYAAIAFAMRANFTSQKNDFAPLPDF